MQCKIHIEIKSKTLANEEKIHKKMQHKIHMAKQKK